MTIFKYRFACLYFLAIVATNALYAWFGETLLWPTPFGAGGETWSPLAIVVGFWFILRDYAQEEMGNKVLLVMLAGMIATYFAAGPGLAVASCAAFALGETLDWLVYTWTKRPFAQRVLISSLVAAPVDTVVFFWLADVMEVIPGVKMLSWPTVLTETASKLLAAYLVYLRIRGQKNPVPEKGDSRHGASSAQTFDNVSKL